MTPKMMAWVIKELQWKAGILSETGYVRIFDVGVLKSDTAISKSLQQALKEQIRPLDNISENQKDYNPRSGQKWLTWCIHHCSRSFTADSRATGPDY